ncbi:hypothetical protein PPL_12603 [Heterostelium album PN500]|uniref:RIC1 C-terminal alpha solenoid region domain-containing protein n=1 Tax=Heterostelium pallidum (strain ATCC 26659 / Pp 5 / PN500) TaxID=670386 RepID=D3BN26_HETP5|nr:hypothetical protein PPL_12603 [Heterostelium album PN500]EFA77388.1 hypothetical protein PPL_12603 [Heterostelium album PN500]|eukprot:XP_020429517.1 hypothetical protein PPL_12603 [Heterostelium album PN500]
MYFAFGWPKVFSSGINETFIDVSHNADGSLIALLSISSISIWSGDQHRIHLGYVIRSEDSINKFGRNQSISWCPDSSAIAVVHLDNSSLLHQSLIPSSQTPALIDCNDAHLALLTSESFFYLYRVVERQDRPGIDLYTLHVLSMAIPSTPLSLSLLPPIQVPPSGNSNVNSPTMNQQQQQQEIPPLQSPRSYSRSNNYFPQFPEVAMCCARKIDATHWPDLFSHVGDPVALYQRCLAGGKIEIAASYLKILQNLESNEFSQRCALDMLEIVLDFDNMDLAGDLVRFMEPEDENLSPTIHSKLEQEKLQILSSYASKLLKSKLLRNFLLFSRKVNMEISHFLASEKRSTILRTAEELDMALNSIHVQFYINLPVDQIAPFSPAAVLSTFSPAPSPSSNGSVTSSTTAIPSPVSIVNNSSTLKNSGSINEREKMYSNSNNNNESTPTGIGMNSSSGTAVSELKLESDDNSSSITRDEMIELLKSRIQMAPSEHHHHHHYAGQQGLVSSTSTESINSLSNSTSTMPSSTTAIYSFKSHQFMVAPSFTNFDVNDPSFLQDSIDSSMDDLYFLLQELTNAGCNEWVLVIGTVLLNPALISKTLKKIPNIYENYCKMLSHQKPQGYSQLLKFIEDTVYPLLSKSQLTSKKYGVSGGGIISSNNNNNNSNNNSNSNSSNGVGEIGE